MEPQASSVQSACRHGHPFCLGMCDWTDCRPLPVNSKKREPLLPKQLLPIPASSERFKFSNEENLSELAKGYTPENTSSSTKWALKVFELWRQARNSQYPDNQVPVDLLTTCDPLLLNNHLSQFAVEARKVNGESYPPSTIHQLLCGLLRHMRDTTPACPNFLNKADNKFRQLHKTLDALFHKLHSNGVGVQVKHTEIITKDDEEKLWISGAMGLSNPRSLQNAAFYVVGKMFSLRGGVEHRRLKLSQLVRHHDPDHYIYYENTSKTSDGSFKKLRVKSKVVPIYSCPEVGERCPVNILDTYLSKLPPKAKECDLFYLRPLSVVPVKPSSPWYASVPVGRDTLQNKLKNMCKQAGIKANITNHSLRASSATQLYDQGVPEKIIQERTGHRSLEALRMYERTSQHQHQAVSSVLSAPSSSKSLYNHFVERETVNFSHTVQQQQSVPHTPKYSFQGLHGCTININAGPIPFQHTPSTSVTDHSELDIDKLFASIDVENLF